MESGRVTSDSSLNETTLKIVNTSYEQIHIGLRGVLRNPAFYCRYCGPGAGRQL